MGEVGYLLSKIVAFYPPHRGKTDSSRFYLSLNSPLPTQAQLKYLYNQIMKIIFGPYYILFA